MKTLIGRKEIENIRIFRDTKSWCMNLTKKSKENFFSIKSLIIREPARDTVQSRAKKKKEKKFKW